MYIDLDWVVAELCPQGVSWFDKAHSPETAHSVAECSSNGHCDRHTVSDSCLCILDYMG